MIRFYLVALIAVLLSCVEGVSVPAKLRLVAGGANANRLLRVSSEADEDRVISAGIENLAGLIKTGASKITANVNLASWFSREQSAVEVLKIFKLDKGMGKALASPNLKLMDTYVKELNTKSRTSKASLIGIFTTHYGDDTVARALVTAQKNAKTPDVAKMVKQLRDDQLSGWLNSGKSVDDVFKLLKLREDGFVALTSRKLEVLDDYMKLVIREKSSHVTLLKTLTKGVGGERKLAKLLVRAKEDPRTSELATALQNALLNKWLTSKFDPESVFIKLNFDNSLMYFLTNRNRDTLDTYISMYNARNPTSKTSLIGLLTARYGEVSVAKTLVTARSQAYTKDIATKLQNQQLQGWLNSEKSADDVFALLKVKDDGIFSMMSRKLDVLNVYINLFNSKQTNALDKTNLFRVVRNGFGGDGAFAIMVARALETPALPILHSTAYQFQKGLFKSWLGSSIKPKSVYTKFFNVEEAAAGTLEKAIVTRYTAYIDKKMAPPQVYTFNQPRRS